MSPFLNKISGYTKQISYLSVAAGVASLLSFFNPPIGLLFGGSAILLALLTRFCNQKFSGTAVAAMILGIFGVLISILIFFNYLFVMRILDNPEALISQISDPAAAQQIRDMLSQYRELLNSLRN
jgi:hypothetical protein